jgi:hypothetical protein
MLMNPLWKIILIPFILLLNRCVKEFIPQTKENKDLLVVEGLITNQPGANIIKLSISQPLGEKNAAKPMKGCSVTISDDLGNIFNLTEIAPGTYVTDTSQFKGTIGRSYTLHITTNSINKNLIFESYPIKMMPVPPIDSLYYEKVAIEEDNNGTSLQEGCQVYVNTHDPTNQTKFYRWEYSETWEFHLPYTLVTNRVCWLSNNSDEINIKSTTSLQEARVERHPIDFISNLTDRLNVKYSILVKQYSLNEDEYLYWEKLENINDQAGGLYDRIPSAIPSNVYCVDDPNEKVLGYFSVSASTSKRTFIKDNFVGLIDLYTHCNGDTIFNNDYIPNLNNYVWIIKTGLKQQTAWIPGADNKLHQIFLPPIPYSIVTYIKGCADCTVRGTSIEPAFWKEGK